MGETSHFLADIIMRSHMTLQRLKDLCLWPCKLISTQRVIKVAAPGERTLFYAHDIAQLNTMVLTGIGLDPLCKLSLELSPPVDSRSKPQSIFINRIQFWLNCPCANSERFLEDSFLTKPEIESEALNGGLTVMKLIVYFGVHPSGSSTRSGQFQFETELL